MKNSANQTFIPLSVPNFSGNEKEYVNDAVVSEWVSSGGSKVASFEEKVAEYVHMPTAVACNSGTSGLHLAMLCAGIGPDDEVLVPALTFIAAVNPVRYAGAQPVFIGCDDSLCIDPDALEAFCRNHCQMRGEVLYNRKTGKRIAAVEVVHVFGNMADMFPILAIAEKYRLLVIEDATEALGSYYTKGPFKGRHAGTMGDVGVYSFNGNKLITTGSGGMLVSNRKDWTEHARHLSTQAKTDELQFLHDEVGYNYRLTNLQAALGLAQMEQVETFIQRKQEMYQRYHKGLEGKKGLHILPFREDVRSNRWFFSLYLEEYSLTRDELIAKLQTDKIQTRPIWALINEQVPYRQNEAFALTKAENYRQKIVNLPCSTNLTDQDIDRVIAQILSY